MVNATPRPLYLREREPEPIVQEAWIPGPVLEVVIYLSLTGIRSSDRPSRNESLHRLSYPGHTIKCYIGVKYPACFIVKILVSEFVNSLYFVQNESDKCVLGQHSVKS